ncbi:MAG: hypothetical protein BECKG1743D_GA0114223_100457 [Candidatus Kentron sp. G]|nr:MAG: hypothetical protein BECKG1743F_GA0114225_100461 [Candidatus Kentron sp. G]VFM98109.1 MAG: hypothetical protein BECKG1743D_GA0114223_100457 [Candidatus Kentron sp. G]
MLSNDAFMARDTRKIVYVDTRLNNAYSSIKSRYTLYMEPSGQPNDNF